MFSLALFYSFRIANKEVYFKINKKLFKFFYELTILISLNRKISKKTDFICKHKTLVFHGSIRSQQTYYT